MRSNCARFHFGACFLVVVATCYTNLPAATGDGSVQETTKPARGRLPAYFSQVVSEEQRQKIYQIQEDYRPKLESLELQRRALLKERNEKIAALLTAEQKKQIKDAATKAKRKRAQAEEEHKRPEREAATDVDKDIATRPAE